MTPWEAGLVGFVLGAIVVEAMHHIDRDSIIQTGWQDEHGFHRGVHPRSPLRRRADADARRLHLVRDDELHEHAEQSTHRHLMN